MNIISQYGYQTTNKIKTTFLHRTNTYLRNNIFFAGNVCKYPDDLLHENINGIIHFAKIPNYRPSLL